MKLFLVSLGVALAAGCGGVVNVAGFDDGGAESGSSGSSSGSAGGACQFCATSQDCLNGCGAPTQTGNVWCCVMSTCYSLKSNQCPASSSGGSGGSGSGGGSGGSSSSSGAGGSGGMGALPCGGMLTCNAPNACCAGLGGGGANMCLSPSACGARGGDAYSCTGAANCPGQVCCVSLGGGPMGSDVARCQGTCTGMNSHQVCQTTMECPNGRMCGRGGGAALNTCQ